MIVKKRDIVTVDFHGKRRMGIVLQENIQQGLSVVAVGYGVLRVHDDPVSVGPLTRDGRMLGLYKETFFYQNRVFLVPNDDIYLSGNCCPAELFNKLVPFKNSAFENSSSDQRALAYKNKTPPRRARPLSVTLGELIKSSS